jgi:hypothetical protein
MPVPLSSILFPFLPLMYSEWGGQEQSMDDQQAAEKIWKSKATVSFACFDERDDDPPTAIERGGEGRDERDKGRGR